MKVIGLAGYGGVGKDAVADILCRHFGFTKFSFSDALYDEVSDAFGVEIGWLMAREIKDAPAAQLAFAHCAHPRFMHTMLRESERVFHRPMDAGVFEAPRSPREVLQWWGDFRRSLDPNYWVDRARDTVKVNIERGRQRLVNTSVRMPHGSTAEVNFIRRELGGQVWRIDRNVPPPNGHSLEVPVPDDLVDKIIVNGGTLSQLEAVIAGAVRGVE